MIALLWGEEGEGGNDPQVSDLSAVAARRPGHLCGESVWMYLSTSRAWWSWGYYSSGGFRLKVET